MAVSTRLQFDDGSLIIASYQDAEPILEANKALRNGPSQKSDWCRHIASVPLNVINKWLNEEWTRGNMSLRPSGEEFDAMFDRKLRDPDYAYLRTDR